MCKAGCLWVSPVIDWSATEGVPASRSLSARIGFTPPHNPQGMVGIVNGLIDGICGMWKINLKLKIPVFHHLLPFFLVVVHCGFVTFSEKHMQPYTNTVRFSIYCDHGLAVTAVKPLLGFLAEAVSLCQD